MTETDAEFLDSMEQWVIGSLVFKKEHRDRLFALARRGAAVEDLGQVGQLSEELERLRAALRRWEHYGCPDCGGDCASANPPVACCIMQETRVALGERT